MVAVRLGKPLRWAMGCEPASLAGMRAGDMARRGKYLWLPLAGQDGGVPPPELPRAGGLLLHLGMSGSLNLSDAPGPAGPHDHFDLLTDRGILRQPSTRRLRRFVLVSWPPWAGSASNMSRFPCSSRAGRQMSTPKTA